MDGPVLLRAPVSLGRTMRTRALTSGQHPHVRAARMIWEHPDQPGHARAILEDYYRTNAPDRFGSWLDIEVPGSRIADLDPRLVPFPWFDRSVDEQAAFSSRVLAAEGRRHGVDLSSSEYWPPLGPMSAAGIDLEVERLTRIVTSVRRSGYRDVHGRSGAVSAWVLVDEDRGTWHWQVKSGNHRAAVATAIGSEVLLVRPRAFIVVRQDAATWPGVATGLYQLDEALHVFDRVTRG